jgi:hypothetical protein
MTPSEMRAARNAEIYAVQDDLLLSITDCKALESAKLQKLPPWRAFMIACVAEQAGIPLEHGTVDQIQAEAREKTGAGILGDWWKRDT